MARTNTKTPKVPAARTAGGAVASRISAVDELRRSVMGYLLWEGSYSEDGVAVADRIAKLVKQIAPSTVASIAIQAREDMKLRHAPLFLVREMVRHENHRPFVADTLARIIQRPDELSEFLAIYWKDEPRFGKTSPLPSSVKKGLARALGKFNAYSLAKYNSMDREYKLRDVLFLTHAKPKDAEQAQLFKQLAENTLPVPDTWEVALSASKGVDKRAEWERLLEDKKLYAMALLRNLRNMITAKVSPALIKKALQEMKTERVLPFRFLAAAPYAPGFEAELEQAMFKCSAMYPKLPGKTVFVVDVSGSMQEKLNAKSTMRRLDTAAAMTVLAREMCEEPVIYVTAGSDSRQVHKTALVPSRRGFSLAETITGSLRTMGGGGIFLTQCLTAVLEAEQAADRVIIFTDEVDCDHKLNPDQAPAFGKTANYLVNVAIEARGIAYNKFVHINGWSQSFMSFIAAYEGIAVEADDEDDQTQE